jgi:hypothetical protein
MAEFEVKELGAGERLYEKLTLARIQASRLKKRLLQGPGRRRAG